MNTDPPKNADDWVRVEPDESRIPPMCFVLVWVGDGYKQIGWFHDYVGRKMACHLRRTVRVLQEQGGGKLEAAEVIAARDRRLAKASTESESAVNAAFDTWERQLLDDSEAAVRKTLYAVYEKGRSEEREACLRLAVECKCDLTAEAIRNRGKEN